ncbi:MAG: glycosyltransferase [Candidatus Cloacimonetes bacterium]|nr:glycosyltransferase [Candidatus Cloacimonadota bacterium]
MNNYRVLVISYFFPPLSGPGVMRAFNFVKNLGRFGWEPIVLTVKDIEYVARDEKLLEELAGIAIYRSGSLDPMRLLHLWRKRMGGRDIYQEAGAVMKKLGRDIFPIDSKLGWLFFAQPLAKRLCRIHNIKIIIATMSPYSSGVLAYLTAKATGLPYVLDYRDLWRGKPDITYGSRWHKKLSVFWEKKLIAKAAAVIQVTQRSAELFLNIYPQCSSEKVKVIFNGYDAEQFAAVARNSEPEIKFTFAGHFYGGQSPQLFLKAVQNLYDSGDLPAGVKFSFAGNYTAAIEHYFTDAPYLERLPYLKYQDYIKKLVDSDVLLLFISNNNSDMIIAQKLFDYLAARHPILAMVPEQGETAEIIRKYKAGIICNPDSLESIRNGISEMLAIITKGEVEQKFPLQTNDYGEFQRSRQAEQLSELLQEISSG